MILSQQKRIALLKKAKELFAYKSYPNFKQVRVIELATKKKEELLQNNMNNVDLKLITKGPFCMHLKNPETSFINIPDLFYLAILQMMEENEIDLSFLNKELRLNTSDLPQVLSMFMEISEQDEKLGKQSLPGDYWGYMPSIEKKGCIVKFVLRIKQNKDGALTSEELFYYRKEGYSDYFKQKSEGYIIEKNMHCLMVLRDASSYYMPKVYMLRKEPSTSNKCLGFEGGSLIVSPSGIGVNTIQRKIRFTRSKEAIPHNKEALINEHGIGIHKPDTDDAVARSLFEKLLP